MTRAGSPPARPRAGPASAASQPLRALAWMMGAIASFVAMAIAGRAIQVEMNTFELMLYRSVIGFAVVCVVLVASDRGFAQVRHHATPACTHGATCSTTPARTCGSTPWR